MAVPPPLACTKYLRCAPFTSPTVLAICCAHSRSVFFELTDIAKNARRGPSATAISSIALEAVHRIDRLFEIEREIRDLWLSAEEQLRIQRREVNYF